jgi:hypothetical protein
VVLSDGEPDDAPSALTEALLMMCQVSSIYCGDESNRAAVRFLRDLASCSRDPRLATAALTSLESPTATARQIEQVLKLSGPS